MNANSLYSLLDTYVAEKLNNRINNPWQVCAGFKPAMDRALLSSDEEFAQQLDHVRTLSAHTIDSLKQPFKGLVKWAQMEPARVKSMLTELFDANEIDLTLKVNTFLEESAQLLSACTPGRMQYAQDLTAVTSYLFFYDPQHSFVYFPASGCAAANQTGFRDTWMKGQETLLPVYNHMCQELAEAARNHFPSYPLSFDAGLPILDSWYHILITDLIAGIRRPPLASQLTGQAKALFPFKTLSEMTARADSARDEMQAAQSDERSMKEGIAYLQSVFQEGATILHRTYGKVQILKATSTILTLHLENGATKEVGTVLSAVKGIICAEDADYAEKLAAYRPFLENEKGVRLRKDLAERNLSPVYPYLEPQW